MNWDLTDLYDNENSLYLDLEDTKKEAISFEKSYKDKLDSLKPKEFLKALDEYEAIFQVLGRVLTYAYLNFATDSKKGSFLAKIQKEATKVEESLLFFEIDFNKIDDEKQKKIIKKSIDKSFYLQNLRDGKKHQLSLLEERVLLKKELTGASAFSRLFDEHLSNLKFNFNGKEVAEEVVLSELYNKNRDIRKKASESLTNGLQSSQHLLTYIFNMIKADLKTDIEIRGYSSPEEPRHKNNKITQKSVDSLVDTVLNNCSLVSEYYKIKKDILGLDKLYDYDRYAPIDNSKDEYSFEKSKEIVLDSFKNFSKKFHKIANKAFDDKWIDVYPKEGKRGGAFSHSATPDVHPYVLLNHTDRRRDLFTLAHELGHAIHQYLSRDVGYFSGDTPLTTSETASIFAEMMVFDYIKEDLSNEELIALYASKLEDIFATLYRQSIFTTFERRVHAIDGEVSSEDFNKIWLEENQKMFKDSVELTDNYKIWWSYIPHFIHSPFYCYAYSYGQLLVFALYGAYKKSENKKEFVKQYTEFLASGGSKSPKELISSFGFDIESSEFWQIGIDEVKRLLNEFREIVKADFIKKGKYKGSSLDSNRVIADIIKMSKD